MTRPWKVGGIRSRYNDLMARGWESKSVAEQQEAAGEPAERHAVLTREQAAAKQRREGLQLSRQRVLDQLQLASNPQHRQMLQAALADLDARLAVIA